MSKGLEFLKGFPDAEEPTAIAPPLPPPPTLPEFFKQGQPLSKTFDQYDKKLAEWSRQLGNFLHQEAFEPQIFGGPVNVTNISQQIINIIGERRPWVRYPIFPDGRIDYENGTWSGGVGSPPPFDVSMHRVPSPAGGYMVGKAIYQVSVPKPFAVPLVLMVPMEKTNGSYEMSTSYQGLSPTTGNGLFYYHLFFEIFQAIPSQIGGALHLADEGYVPASWIYVQLY